MAILLQLGANQTAFIQFVIFIISISFLTVYVYGPYFQALDKRQLQTKGAEQVATETEEEARKLESIFKAKAREINEKIKNIFEASRTQASGAAGAVVDDAKGAAAELTEKARKEISLQKAAAEKDIQAISQTIAAEISKKITGAV